MADDVVITYHAAERFVQRYAPELTIKEGKKYLEEQATTAARLKEKTVKGDQQWQIEDPYCTLVMKKDWKSRLWVCVTVLPEPQGYPIPPEEMEMMREHIYNQASQDKMPSELVDEMTNVLQGRPRVDLIRPSMQYDAEVQRVTQEKKLWNRALGLLDRHLKGLRDIAQQEARVASDHANLVSALRLVLNSLNDGVTDPSEILQRVQEIDPSFTTEAFLQPHEYTKQERQEITQGARGGQKSVVDFA